jgi:hypothetical protein
MLELFGRSVGRDDDLLIGVVQGVEGVEELLLDTFFALDELNIVDQQHIDIPVTALEGHSAVITQGVDEVVGEFLSRDVFDSHAWEKPLCVVAGSV